MRAQEVSGLRETLACYRALTVLRCDAQPVGDRGKYVQIGSC